MLPSKPSCRRAALIGLGALATFALVPVAAAAPPTVAPATVRLADGLAGSPLLAKAADGGAMSPGTRMQVEVTFGHDMKAINAFVHSVYDPHSANYHHYLTPASFQQRFGASAATVAQVERYVARDGLTLVNAGHLGDAVLAVGTAAQVERTFDVDLHLFHDRAGHTVYANINGARVPAGVGVNAVLGLNNLADAHLARLTGRMTSVPAQAECDPSGQFNQCIGALQPNDLWSGYQQPGGRAADPNGNTTTNFGQGVSVGIIGEGRTDDVIGALREFEKTRHLPQVPVQVHYTDGGPYTDDGGRIEWELDSQAITGMAPDISKLYLYFASSLALTSLTTSLQTWANDPDGPPIANASLGICEDNPALDIILGAPQAADQVVLASAAAQGKTLFAATGDTGSGCLVLFNPPVSPPPPAGPLPSPPANGILYGELPFAEYPAADQHAVAVGGTVLYTTPDGQRATERAWDHGGGEPSEFLAQPDYQHGVDVLSNVHCVSQPDGTPYDDPTQLCRGIADVSAESGDVTDIVDHKIAGNTPDHSDPFSGNAYDIVDDCPADEGPQPAGSTGCAYNEPPGSMIDHFGEGGTSLSSPLWAGMWARVLAAYRPPTPDTTIPGFADEVIYPIAQKFDGAFYDVPAGSTNGAWPTISHSGQTSGYDFPTGWGSPNLDTLIKDVDGGDAPVNSVLPSGPDPAPIVPVGAITGPEPLTPLAVACDPLATDPAGDEAAAATPVGSVNHNNNLPANPQLDIVQADMHDDGQLLKTVITVKNLSATPPPGAGGDEYVFRWTYADTTYFTAVDIAAGTGTPTYEYGTASGNSLNFVGNATGTVVPGPNGTVEVDVPFGSVGAPAPGAALTAARAETDELAGYGGSGFYDQADTAGPHNDYTIGEVCPSNGARGSNGAAQPGSDLPEMPLPAIAGIGAALAIATTALTRRRRRGDTD